MIKIERNPIPPSSLAVEEQKAKGDYNKPDVIQRLKADFLLALLIMYQL